MKWIYLTCLALCAFNVNEVFSISSMRRINFYEKAKTDEFNKDEFELLTPIINTLQGQYDAFFDKSEQNVSLSTDQREDHMESLLSKVLQDFLNEDTLLIEPYKYDTSLPSFEELKIEFNRETPTDEVYDMENILQENIDEARNIIQDLITESNQAEEMLLSINKIKILKFIYNSLGDILEIGSRLSRAAYCTYSYIPLMNSTLTEGRANISLCYINAKKSIQQLRHDVQTSINDIRENVVELIAIYKKIANRKSLLGKLFTLLMNVSKIKGDINKSRSTALKTIEQVKTEVPDITGTAQACGTYAIPTFVQQLNETITTLTTCINFVDDSTPGPEPEPESYEETSDESADYYLTP